MKILYLYPRRYYETKRSITRILCGQAVARQPGVTLKMWGAGWPGYDNEASLRANIEKTDERYDVVWCYKADEQKEVGKCRLPIVVCFDECHSTALIHEADSANIVIFHHATDFLMWGDKLKQRDVKAAKLFHCIDPSYFEKPTPMTERPIDCLSSGACDSKIDGLPVYPLRRQLKGIIERGLLKGNVVTRRNAYPENKTHEDVKAQHADYCAQLMNSKIGLACSSRYRYLLRKMHEIPAAGAVLATDVPLYEHRYLAMMKDSIILISSGDNDERISAKINERLSDLPALIRDGEKGRKVMMENYTTDHYARSFVEIVSSC